MDADAKYARVSITRFKEGEREEGNKVLERYLRQEEEGYLGYLTLYSIDAPDKATYVTLWSSEEAMVNSLRSNQDEIYRALGDLIAGPAEMEHHRIKEMKI